MNIKQTLTDGGLYSPLYDIQIEQTEMAIKELKKMQTIVNKEGRTIEKQTKNGSEWVCHPLLPVINQFHRTITQQLASLGMNRMKLQGETKSKDAEMMAFLD